MIRRIIPITVLLFLTSCSELQQVVDNLPQQTNGNNIAGDPQQELSALGTDIGSQFVLNFSELKFAYSSLLTYHMNNYSVDVDGLSQKSKISVDKIQKIIDGNAIPSNLELQSIAKSLQVNIRDLLPSDIIPEKVTFEELVYKL